MAHVVTQPCCKDAGCVAVCPVDCIHPTPAERLFRPSEMLYIDPEACIDCGACVDECPVDAIVPPEDITPETRPFVEINAAYYQDDPVPSPQPEPQLVEVGETPGVLRVAVVGSGPSAGYLVEALLAERRVPVEISILEKLPVPGGLVRFGVAPDHRSTKEITAGFLRAMGRKNVDVFLDVEVGKHVTHEDLLQHHHAVVYASGTSGDRAMGVPGEGMRGSVSAREFVAWYNGHPDYADRKFDLSCERAMIVGNGNVALDVARILSSDVSRLRKTDIAAHALESLAASRIREVVVLGRRGAGARSVQHAGVARPHGAARCHRHRIALVHRIHSARPNPGGCPRRLRGAEPRRGGASHPSAVPAFTSRSAGERTRGGPAGCGERPRVRNECRGLSDGLGVAFDRVPGDAGSGCPVRR